MRGSTSASAAAVCTAAINMLQVTSSPPPHARAFGLQLLACCLVDSGESNSSNLLTLAQAVSLINLCSSSITQDHSSNAETSMHVVSSFAPYPYPLVLPLPEQPLPPLNVAAAAGVEMRCYHSCSYLPHAWECHNTVHAPICLIATRST